jgi:hypothetical protein
MTIRVWMNTTCEKTFKNDNQRWKMKRSYIYIEYIKLNHHYHHPACIRTCIYAHTFVFGLACLLNDFNLFSISFSLITYVHHIHVYMYMIGIWKKKVDLELLYWSSFSTIWDRSCETNLLKRITKKKKRKKERNLYYVCKASTYNVRITFYTFEYFVCYSSMVSTMSIDYLHEKWNLMSNNTLRYGTEKETLEIIIIIKSLQLNVDIRKKKKKKRESTINYMYILKYKSHFFIYLMKRCFFFSLLVTYLSI